MSQHKVVLPWAEVTAPNRLPPRLCVNNARESLNKAFGYDDRAAVPLLLEAVDWLRRALEQMAEALDERN